MFIVTRNLSPPPLYIVKLSVRGRILSPLCPKAQLIGSSGLTVLTGMTGLSSFCLHQEKAPCYLIVFCYNSELSRIMCKLQYIVFCVRLLTIRCTIIKSSSAFVLLVVLLLRPFLFCLSALGLPYISNYLYTYFNIF